MIILPDSGNWQLASRPPSTQQPCGNRGNENFWFHAAFDVRGTQASVREPTCVQFDPAAASGCAKLYSTAATERTWPRDSGHWGCGAESLNYAEATTPVRKRGNGFPALLLIRLHPELKHAV